MTRAASHPDAQKWLPKCARTAQRFGSICSGAFVLASLGMLSKARVATHWASCAALAEFPEVSVDAEFPVCGERQPVDVSGNFDRDRHGARNGRAGYRPRDGRSDREIYG